MENVVSERRWRPSTGKRRLKSVMASLNMLKQANLYESIRISTNLYKSMQIYTNLYKSIHLSAPHIPPSQMHLVALRPCGFAALQALQPCWPCSLVYVCYRFLFDFILRFLTLKSRHPSARNYDSFSYSRSLLTPREALKRTLEYPRTRVCV